MFVIVIVINNDSVYILCYWERVTQCLFIHNGRCCAVLTLPCFNTIYTYRAYENSYRLHLAFNCQFPNPFCRTYLRSLLSSSTGYRDILPDLRISLSHFSSARSDGVNALLKRLSGKRVLKTELYSGH